MTTEMVRGQRFFQTLYFRVLVGVVAGTLTGFLWPHFGEALKPLSDAFIKLVRMMIARSSFSVSWLASPVSATCENWDVSA